MRRRGTALAIAMFMVVAAAGAACGGTTNQTATPGEPTSAAPLPSVSPTDGGGGGGGGETTAPEADGEEVFAANCSSCHGETGQGGFGPDLTGMQDVSLVKETVTNGRGQMPAFGGQLSAAEIAAVAGYVVEKL